MTKENWKEIFQDAGIQKGSFVLFQENLERTGYTFGGRQAVLEVLMDVVSEQGCVVVPAFTRSCLDPACIKGLESVFNEWPQMRRSQKGFELGMTDPDPDCQMAALLEKYPGTMRSDHPVYSFVFWGSYDPLWQKQPMDFPLDLDSVLGMFEEKRAMTFLAGIDKEKSILLQALAHYMHMDVVSVKKGYLKKPRRSLSKVFLTGCCRKEKWPELLELVQCEDGKAGQADWSAFRLYSTPARTRAILSSASVSSEEKEAG